MIARADAVRLPFADRTVDLVMGSPPYIDARLYLEDGADLGISRDCREWVEWMLAVTHRLRDGSRVNRPVHKVGGGRRSNGKSRLDEPRALVKSYSEPDIANPGNLLSTGATGGNHLGSPLAHENEAPYPQELAEWFVASHCPPGGLVLDPFSGSGTTVAASLSLGRRGVGCDLRQSQCLLSRKRIGTVTPGFAFAEDL
jgi:hypothetical protein